MKVGSRVERVSLPHESIPIGSRGQVVSLDPLRVQWDYWHHGITHFYTGGGECIKEVVEEDTLLPVECSIYSLSKDSKRMVVVINTSEPEKFPSTLLYKGQTYHLTSKDATPPELCGIACYFRSYETEKA